MRELRGRLPSPVALAMTALLLVSAASCARSAPTGPDSVVLAEVSTSSMPTMPGALVGTTASSAPAIGPVTSFDLSAGTFVLTTSDGDRLAGRYTGRADVAALGKHARASLDLHVEGGAGAFYGASGTLRGEGKGSFTGEGPFRLSLDGQLSTAKHIALRFHAVGMGTSQLSCVNEHLLLTLHGTGSATRFGRVELELQHQVENAGCSS